MSKFRVATVSLENKGSERNEIKEGKERKSECVELPSDPLATLASAAVSTAATTPTTSIVKQEPAATLAANGVKAESQEPKPVGPH